MENITLDGSLMDELGPEEVIIIRDPAIDLRGFLVIDNSRYGIPMGSIRIAPDLVLNEIIRLARSMSLKAASFKIPLGGASAGLIFDPKSEKKSLYIGSFGEELKPMIKQDIFYPEPGLGSTDKDIEHIFKLSGRPELIPRKIGIFKYDIPLKKTYIGVSVSYCIKTICSKLKNIKGYESFGEWNKPIKVLLEGFGRAGREIARHLKQFGYQLLGISTLGGAIFDEDGLNIDQLLELKKKYGDGLVNHYESKNLVSLSREKLFELSSDYSVDFLIPGARPNVINKDNIDKIKPKAIVSASRIPYEVGITKELNEAEILAFPDFISSSGDILAFSTRKKTKTDSVNIEEHIQSQISEITLDILQEASQNNISPYEFAQNRAEKELKKKLERRIEHRKKLKDLLE
ncbi:MAG: putative Glutamate dehydrogenase [Promethearchaeota archaeon]|nr:MAG: putative Glutamate dehydrogenase [Candidatus Lokiarchaeota archaeon]